ncbi:MAG: type II secretion system F family protein [Actinobacteria bacterium]|nr:type II secretion system F family protein [Actinomycetota bacterium]
MESTVTRVDEMEVASFLDRIALFCTEGCRPQQALRFAWSSLLVDTPLHHEIRTMIDSARDGKSSADVLLQVGHRVNSEALVLASMAVVEHLVAGIDLSHSMTRLADVVRWQSKNTKEKGFEFEREFAVALLAGKLGYLAEIDKAPREALTVLADHDTVLGPELSRIRQDIAAGHPIAEAFARSAERMGSKGMMLLAEAIDVSTGMGVRLDTVLSQVAEVIRRDLGV